MERGVIFLGTIPAWWQHAKTRCVFEIYGIIFIFGNTHIFKKKIFNHQNMVLLYIYTTAFQCRGGGLPIVPLPFVPGCSQNPPIQGKIRELQTYLSSKHTENSPQSMHLYLLN